MSTSKTVHLSVNLFWSLQVLVPQTRQEFERRNLDNAVRLAKDEVEEQRLWLDTMKQKKVALQTEIRRLKDLREQLTTAP